MNTEWIKILRNAGMPTNVLVLDFESYFDAEYSLTKLSTIEYVQSEQFEPLGVACLEMSGEQPYLEPQAHFWADVPTALAHFQTKYGQHLAGCSLVTHNARFDASILTYRYNIRSPFVVDTLGLARHVAARKLNHLRNLCERYDLIGKGDTNEFKGLHQDTMTDAQRKNLAAYAENDAMREWELFCILLPMLTRPSVELRLIAHTSLLFTRPLMCVDFQKADELLVAMDAEKNKTLDAVKWVLDEN